MPPPIAAPLIDKCRSAFTESSLSVCTLPHELSVHLNSIPDVSQAQKICVVFCQKSDPVTAVNTRQQLGGTHDQTEHVIFLQKLFLV